MLIQFRGLLLAAMLAVSLPGCFLLTQQINRQWPPVDVEAKIRQATRESSLDASKVPGPDILVTVAAADVRRLVVAELDKRNGELSSEIKLSRYSIATRSQGIALKADFSGTALDGNLQITGTLEGFAAVAVRDEDQRVVAVFKPAFENIKITKIRGKSWYSLANSARGTISDLLNRYRDNLNGALEEVLVPLAEKKAFAGGNVLEFREQKVSLEPITLAGAGLLIDEAGLHGMLGFNYPSRGAASTPDLKVTEDYGQYRKAFVDLARKAFNSDLAPSSQLAFAPGFLRDYFKATLPEVSVREILASAVDQERKNLSGFPTSAGAFFSASSTKQRLSVSVKQAVDDFNRRGVGIIEIQSVELAPQRVELVANVKGFRIEGVGALDASIKALGVFRSGVGVVNIVPVIQDLRVTRFTVNQPSIGFDLVSTAVGGVFGEALGFINAALKPQELRIPEPLIGDIILPEPGAVPGLRLSARRIVLPPLVYTGTAVMVDDAGIWAISGLSRAPGAMPIVEGSANAKQMSRALSVRAAAIEMPADFNVLQAEFFRAWDLRLDRPVTGSRGSLMLSKASAAEYLNSVWRDVTLSADYSSTLRSKIDPIELRIKNGIQECNRRSCERNSSCELRECRRGGCERGACGRQPGECDFDCTVNGPFGSRFDDPFCLGRKAACNLAAEARVAECNVREEAARAACNVREETALAACKTQAEAERLACNAREEGQVAACNVAAEAELAGCNTLNGINSALNEIGGLGRLEGDLSFDGTAHAELGELSITPDFSNISLRPFIAVNGRLGGSLDFLPYDIGHLLVCPTRGKVGYQVNVSAPRQQINATASIATRSAADLFLDIAIPPIEYRATIDPPPARAIVEQNPQIIVTCPVVGGLLAGGAIVGQALPEDFIRKASPEAAELLSGTVRRKTDRFSMSLRIPGLELPVNGAVLRASPGWGRLAIGYEVK